MILFLVLVTGIHSVVMMRLLMVYSVLIGHMHHSVQPEFCEPTKQCVCESVVKKHSLFITLHDLFS
jgi:hypothetical protein